MGILSMFSRAGSPAASGAPLQTLLAGYSIEVMPRTFARIEDPAAAFLPGMRVFIAHISGTGIDDMVATARRLAELGCVPVPHLPARLLPDRHALADWLARYEGEAGVRNFLMLAGGLATPAGPYDSSIAMLETGLFTRDRFDRLYFAGHPEGNRDIDADGSDRHVDAALAWKQAWCVRSDIDAALVTQFVFDAEPVLAWSRRIAQAGINLPIHVGLAGPAKLQTLLKYAVSCGVGPSLKVLQKRATDITRLMVPYAPDEVASRLADQAVAGCANGFAGIHLFPLGGIQSSLDWARERMDPESGENGHAAAASRRL